MGNYKIIGKDNNLKLIQEIIYRFRLNIFCIYLYCGFKVNDGEYKLMGLAPYGKPIYKDLIYKNLVYVNSDGSFKLNQKYFDYSSGLKMINKKFEILFKKAEKAMKRLNNFLWMLLLLSNCTRGIILKICRYLKETYKKENICLAGGVALNCVANGKSSIAKTFKKYLDTARSWRCWWSTGAALYLWYNIIVRK